MAIRPPFNQQMTPEFFQSFYWYKIELQDICRRYQLPSYGTKAELTDYIIQFLEGIPVANIQAKRKNRRKNPTGKSLSAEQITPATKLLDSGFSFNQEARTFFCRYFDVAHFSFKKSMAIKMREVEEMGDTEATVQDLIDVFAESKVSLSSNREEQTYQWNRFVKDFNNDPQSKLFAQPMKVAAILWKEVRQSNRDKIYQTSLIKDYAREIEGYRK
ncbi:SAP domain-containing protein [Streptococcus dentapri]|uniref:SAP domain-containing protein n=1 Tax=Streptococcus dentapri TaxID=573564 RepID=A0ABV8D1Z5_9STRE